MRVEEWIETKLGQDIWNKKYRFENETFDKWLDRVSGENKEVKRLIREKKFLFGGRTLSNRGTGKNASYSNCYSSGYVPDSLSGIMELNTNLALTYKAQGGQGLSLSKIRPKGTKINGQFESDGIIPFMKIFNQTTESVSQGGSRKGALLMSLASDHKEIEDFIDIKTRENSITKANLSVEIDDNFMLAVRKFYDTGEVVKIHIKKEYEGNVVEYELTPINIYKKIMQSAYDWAEPGVLLVNRFRNYNLMEYIDEYMVITGNPCGEQPLPKDGACNLGSMNLSAYVINPFSKQAYFDMQSFQYDVAIAIEGLDEVLDEGMKLHALESQRQMAHDYRNVGLGIMGLGDMFFKLGIKYGSEESKNLVNNVMYLMFISAVRASAKLAQEKGSFPKYSDKVYDSTIIKNHFDEDEIKQLKKIGLRNCSLLSVAPSGSIGTMLDVTTGIEPAFQLSYKRKTESLHKDQEVYYDIFISSAKEYLDLNNTDKLPDYFVTTNNINWKDRVDIQAIAQNHVDTAISSTVNLPVDISIEEVEKLYLYAWEQGLKGITIYREGCKRGAILSSNTDNKQTEELKPKVTENTLTWGTTIASSDDLIGRKHKIMSGCGSVHVQAWFDPSDGRLTEIYLSKGSDGVCSSWLTSNSRIISAALRTGLSFDYLIDQLKSAPTCPSYAVRSATKKDTSKGNSCPVAVANALVKMQKDVFYELGIDEEEVEIPKVNVKVQPIELKVKLNINSKNICPECGEELQFQGGCNSCPNCAYTKCE